VSERGKRARAYALVVPTDPAMATPAPIDLGPVGRSASDDWAHCGTGADMALLATRWTPTEEAPPQVWVWRRRGAGFAPLGHGETSVLSPRPVCGPDAVTLTWFDSWETSAEAGRAVLRELRCTEAGCAARSVTVSGVRPGVQVSALGARTLEIWDDPQAGVVYRLAPFEALDSAPIATLVARGKQSLWPTHILVLGDAALVLLTTASQQTIAVSVSADGTAAAIPLVLTDREAARRGGE
jgi:hypothetical protein